MKFYIFLLFAYSTIAIVNGAPTPKEDTCFKKLPNITDVINSLEMDNPKTVERFLGVCEYFDTCTEPLKRLGLPPNVTTAIDKMRTICDSVRYINNQFITCGEKLKATNATCSYIDPFEKVIEGDAESERIHLEACKNFFGKDNCLEKVITDECGEKTWHLIKKAHLEMNKTMKACDLE